MIEDNRRKVHIPELPPRRPAFMGDPRQDRLLDRPISRIPIATIMALTKAKTNDRRSSDTSLEDNDPIELAPNHIFLYKPGKLSVFGGNQEDFFKFMKSRPQVILVLNIRKSCPIPASWVSALKDLKQEYSCFNFIRLHDIDAEDSSAMIYVDGQLQKDKINLSHSRQLCLTDEALIELIEPIILHHRITSHRKSVSNKSRAVLESINSASPSTATVPESPAQEMLRPTKPFNLAELEARWAKGAQNWHTINRS